MKRLMTLATLLIASVLAGCATPNLGAFAGRGDEVIYGRVKDIHEGNRMVGAREVLCGKRYPVLREKTFTSEVDSWLVETQFCKPENLDNIKQVLVTLAVVNANGDMFNALTFVPKDMPIDKGDIVAVKMFPGADGRYRRPEQLLRVVRKEAEATKESGCYWDAGTGVWSGFNQGGAVCEGWSWRDHPFTNPKLQRP